MIKECIILAGGLGTRLRSAVPDLPKCMAPVAGKPFLHYVINHFLGQGIERFIFSLGYRSEDILDYLHKNLRAEQFSYVVEEEPLGTGGAIKLACEKVSAENVLVTNGDTLFRISVDKLAALHFENEAKCTICLKPMQNFDRYGVVEIGKVLHRVKSFHEKKFYHSGLINGGVYVLDVPFFKEKNWPAKFSFENQFLQVAYMDEIIYGQVQDEYFIDIGIPEDYEKANVDFAQMKL